MCCYCYYYYYNNNNNNKKKNDDNNRITINATTTNLIYCMSQMCYIVIAIFLDLQWDSGGQI